MKFKIPGPLVMEHAELHATLDLVGKWVKARS